MAPGNFAQRRVSSSKGNHVLRQFLLRSCSGPGTRQMYFIVEELVVLVYRKGNTFAIITTSEVREAFFSSVVNRLPCKDFVTNELGLQMRMFGQYPTNLKHNGANQSIERYQMCDLVSGVLLYYVFPHYTNPLHESESPNQDNEHQSNAGTENQTSRTRSTQTSKYPNNADADKRLATYRGWPLAEPNPNTLCAVGFFFTGHSYDLVRCFCCGIGLKDFSDTDNPLLEHAKHSSNCPFIIDYFGSRAALEAYKQRFANQDPEEIKRRQRELNERQQGRSVTIYTAKHERFRTLKSRLETFTHWPQHLSQRPKELTDAGMFYTGVDDHCRCFACDGGLRNWEPGDDPWIEHCRWFPACPYAREVKGDEFISLVLHSADQALKENRGDEINDAMAALIIDDPNTQRIIDRFRDILIQDMGFPINDITTAVLELVKQASRDPDIEDIITRLEIINERRPLDGLFQRTAVQPKLETILKQDQRLRDLLLCHSCHTNQANCLFLPCTHHKYCLDCAQIIDRCPFCDRQIKERIRTYMA